MIIYAPMHFSSEHQVTSCQELVEVRQQAVISGRRTYPWQSSDGQWLGLLDPADDFGGTLYVLSMPDYLKTRDAEGLDPLVIAALQSPAGWIDIFGGAFCSEKAPDPGPE